VITYNLANILTLSRLLMSIVFFVLIAFESRVAVPVLLVAGFTDILDGWVARRYHQQTDFGRIADPAMDKVLICCGFILLVGISDGIVLPWMAAVVVGRELVVQALRSLAESRGVEFAATLWGKSKMAVQFATMTYVISIVLWGWSRKPEVLRDIALIAIWVTVVVTIMSGLVYIFQANKLVGKRRRA